LQEEKEEEEVNVAFKRITLCIDRLNKKQN
jgi:hypothetical protein